MSRPIYLSRNATRYMEAHGLELVLQTLPASGKWQATLVDPLGERRTLFMGAAVNDPAEAFERINEFTRTATR